LVGETEGQSACHVKCLSLLYSTFAVQILYKLYSLQLN